MTHRTTWPEERVLDYFYVMSRDLGVDRMALLKQLSDVALERPREWDRTAVRLAMAGVKLQLTADGCFCCYSREWQLVWHHIIQVQHGGSSAPRNVVAICVRCHRTLHPWLEPVTSADHRWGWTRLGDLAKRALDKLTAAWDAKAKARADDDQPF